MFAAGAIALLTRIVDFIYARASGAVSRWFFDAGVVLSYGESGPLMIVDAEAASFHTALMISLCVLIRWLLPNGPAVKAVHQLLFIETLQMLNPFICVVLL